MELQRRRMIAKQLHIQHLKELAEKEMLSEEAYIKQAILKNRMHVIPFYKVYSIN